MQDLKSPSIYEYFDVILYLQAYYNYRKSLDDKFSYKVWSSELNYNSKSFLRLILAGKKRLPSKLAESIALKNIAQLEQREYFRCLVGYSRSASATEKEIFGQRMIQILKNSEAAGNLISFKLDLPLDKPSSDTDRYPQGVYVLTPELEIRLKNLLNEISLVCNRVSLSDERQQPIISVYL